MKHKIYLFLLVQIVCAFSLRAQSDDHVSVLNDGQGPFVSRYDSIRVGDITQMIMDIECENRVLISDQSMSTGSIEVVMASEFQSGISNGRYAYIYPASTTGNPRFEYNCRRPVGVYDIYAVMVPNYYRTSRGKEREYTLGTYGTAQIVNGDTVPVKHKFVATLSYPNDLPNGKKATISSETVNYEGEEIAQILLFSDFDFGAFSYEHEREAFLTGTDKYDVSVTITTKTTSSERKAGYSNDFCIDKLVFVPKGNVAPLQGITIFEGKKSLSVPREIPLEVRTSNIDLAGVYAKVNPKNFADVKICGGIKGVEDVVSSGKNIQFGVDIQSITTTDAYGHTYSNQDYGEESPRHFLDFDFYSHLPFNKDEGTLSYGYDILNFEQPLPMLLPNSTVTYTVYADIEGKHYSSDTLSFTTPAFTSNLLSIQKPVQQEKMPDISITIDDRELASRMRLVTVPLTGSYESNENAFVDQRQYGYYQCWIADEGAPEGRSWMTINMDTTQNSRYIFPFEMTRRAETGEKPVGFFVSLPDFRFVRDYYGNSPIYRYKKSEYEVDKYRFRSVNGDYITYAVTSVNPQDSYVTSFHYQSPSDTLFQDAGSTILQDLTRSGNFTNTVKLMNDVDVVGMGDETLAAYLDGRQHRTVYVADDDAWNLFYDSNKKVPASSPWYGATSYEKLTAEQKNVLVYQGILGYAVESANLSSSTEQQDKIGEWVRREVVQNVPSIQHLPATDVPQSKNPNESDYWQRFHQGNGIYLERDSATFISFLTDGYLQKNQITDADVVTIMGKSRVPGDVHVNGIPLTEVDGLCSNGYVNVAKEVVTPLPNMAEFIRTNNNTQIFSHMLDRWSAPYYSHRATEAYKELMKKQGVTWTDSIFSKRYISQLALDHQPLDKDPQGDKFPSSVGKLKFDPAWGGIYDVYGPQAEMAAMYVPNDDALWKYFTKGGEGWPLIQSFYLREGMEDEIAYTRPTTLDELYQQIDQIPMNILQNLINIIMFKSFTASVPSKITKLRDDAQEQIFYQEDQAHIQNAQLTNNGVVYITDKVYGPADYTSVAAPAFIGDSQNAVMKFAIYNGSGIFGGSSDYMGMNYYAHLKSMRNRYAFFMPTDKALQYYYDVYSFTSQKPRSLKFAFDWTTRQFPIKYTIWAYDLANGEIGKQYNLEKMTNNEVTNRLKEILESHTINMGEGRDINSEVDEYYLARNGAPIKVSRGKDDKGNPCIIKVQGGFQLDNEVCGITSKDKGVTENNIEETYAMSNGCTYQLDSPIIPTSKSVYNLLSNGQEKNSPYYSRFFDLCEVNEEIVRACGLVDQMNLTQKQQASMMKKYQVFVYNNGADYNVRFFNNYNYTIFAPTSEAIDQAVAKGLPTWEAIQADYESLKNSDGEYVLSTADSLRLQAKITCLIHFVQNHFADGSVFVDNSILAAENHTTASYDNDRDVFNRIVVQRPSAKCLQVKDNQGGNWLTVSGKYNVMANDFSCSASPTGKSTMNGITVDAASYVVIHQIPGVLNPTKLVGGRYDSQWKTAAASRKYLKSHAIKD